MITFLEETIRHIKEKHPDVSSVTMILPSKRAGGFLLDHLKKNTPNTTFAPNILSIEEFIEELSGIKIIDATELLFKSYEAYRNTFSTEKDNFDTYTSWATTLLNDFNEIDRYLIPPKQFFSYLNSIQDLNHWYVRNEKTPLIEDYLRFWNNLHEFYNLLKLQLLKEGVGYQGLVYREAADAIGNYIESKGNKTHLFIGFNALNNCEQIIIQELLETGNTEIYWDADVHFYKDDKHSASYFLRKYTSEWSYFKKESPRYITKNFENEKNFHFIEVQKNIGQAKYVGQLLSGFSNDDLNKTAIILADERLLIPLLHSLPPNIKSVNITMGVILKTFPAVVFFELLLALHSNFSKTLYFKDVLAILNHPLASILLSVKKIVHNITTENITHLSPSKIIEINDGANKEILHQLFGDWKDNSTIAITTCKTLLLQLKKQPNNNIIEKVVLFELFKVFEKIDALNYKFEYLKTIKTTQNLFSEIISTTTLDFIGDAYNGLQIMGVLETRVLDFENIIITSVNEGILPSGKSNTSFITYDLKQQFGLPLYTEKDAIYTYHFYRLLHRAKNISLLYNSFTEGINTGEKSRFLTQLEIERHPNHTIEKIIVSPSISVFEPILKKITKNEDVMKRLKEISLKGFSPSALTSYIRNPLDFYYQKILKINEFQEVEETVAAITLGTIVHNTLETLYKPLEKKYLTPDVLLEIKQQIDTEVTLQFKRIFKGGSFSKGKNLIIFEVAKRYILNFINFELSEIKAGNQIKILKIESDLKVEINIPELNFPIKIQGKVDRVDDYNGQLRIIDFKTGFVKQGDLEIVEWGKITTDYKYSKIIQVLAYALMIKREIPFEKAQAGIISFKNLSNGYLKFGVKTSPKSKSKNQEITQETLDYYLVELKKLILEICDVTIPFNEKEI
ncbi:MAG: PD-(D/E)XK nuclease family protein [Bacteroidetes bacterium]|nr:PD-(D/E)XK nuclease family protein [Bacteroidota bacterium]